jgi:hypothetical protein
MTPTLEDRRTAVEAFGEVLGGKATSLLEKALPSHPWRVVLDPSVLLASDFVAAHASPDRKELHDKLEELVGEQRAGVLMEFLLPTPARTIWQVEDRLGLRRTTFE